MFRIRYRANSRTICHLSSLSSTHYEGVVIRRQRSNVPGTTAERQMMVVVESCRPYAEGSYDGNGLEHRKRNKHEPMDAWAVVAIVEHSPLGRS